MQATISNNPINNPISFHKDFDDPDDESRRKLKTNGRKLKMNDTLTPQSFEVLKDNTNVLQDEDELYSVLLREDSKNLDKLSRILEKKQLELPVHQMPLYSILQSSVRTVEKVSKKIANNEIVELSHRDKTYLGVALALVAISIAVII